MAGVYKHKLFGDSVRIYKKDGRLFMEGWHSGGEDTEMMFLGNGSFLIDEFPGKAKFESGEDGKVTYLVLYRDGIDPSNFDRNFVRTNDDVKRGS